MKQSDFNCLFGLLILVASSTAVPLVKESEESGDFNSPQDNVCLWEGKEYAASALVPSLGPCEQCICEPPDVVCNMIKCKTNSGCKMIQRANHCCPLFKCDCEYKGKVYNNGERLDNPDDPCQVCYCKGGEIMCTSITCYERVDCEPHYVPGQCCPKYDHCPMESQKNGTKSANASVFGSKREIQPWLMTKPVTVKPIEKVKQTTVKREEFVPVNNIYPQTLKIHEILPTTAKYDHPNGKRPVVAHFSKPSTEKTAPPSTVVSKSYEESTTSGEETTSESIEDSTTFSTESGLSSSHNEESSWQNSGETNLENSSQSSLEAHSSEEIVGTGITSSQALSNSEEYNSSEEVTSQKHSSEGMQLNGSSSEETATSENHSFKDNSTEDSSEIETSEHISQYNSSEEMDSPQMKLFSTEAPSENIYNMSDSNMVRSKISYESPSTEAGQGYDDTTNLLNLSSDLSVWDEVTTEGYSTHLGAEPTETVKIRSVGSEEGKAETTVESMASTLMPHSINSEIDQASEESNNAPVETVTTEEAPFVLKGGVYQVTKDTTSTPKNTHFDQRFSIPVVADSKEGGSELNERIMEVSRSYSGVRRSDDWSSSGFESLSAEDNSERISSPRPSYNNDYSFESSGDSMYQTQGYEIKDKATEPNLGPIETLEKETNSSVFSKIKDVEGESGLHIYVTSKDFRTNQTSLLMVLSPLDLKRLALTLLKEKLDKDETSAALEVGWLPNNEVAELGSIPEESKLDVQLLKCQQREELEEEQKVAGNEDIEGGDKANDVNNTSDLASANEKGTWTFTHKMATNMMIPSPDVEFISTTDVDVEETLPPEYNFPSTTEKLESVSNGKIVNHTVHPMRVYEVLNRVTPDSPNPTDYPMLNKSEVKTAEVSSTPESYSTIKKTVLTSVVPEVDGNRIENSEDTVNSSEKSYDSYEVEEESDIVTTVDPSMITESGATLVSRKVPDVEPFLRQLPSSLDEHDVSILREFLERHFTES